MKTPEEKKKMRIGMTREFDSSITLFTVRLKRTPHRLAILDIFRHTTEPVSIEEIRILLSKRLPRSTLYPDVLANPATIYRTIATFEKSQLIWRVGGKYELC
jgi:Fe2+ or Zn2+ uptake regulation protein